MMMAAHSRKNSNHAVQKQAVELLEWLIDFLPGAIPRSAERAIIEDCDDVHVLFDQRSELQKILETTPHALNQIQKKKLAKFDRDMRAAALFLFGASKGTLRRYREGRYDRSHWWWYIDDLVREANLVCNKKKKGVEYTVSEEAVDLLKVAEPRASYGRRTNARKKESK
jgi:hypothetical protein